MHYPVFNGLLLLLAVLNLADYGLTLWALSRGIPEGNPIMDAALDVGVFHLVKAALPTALLLLAWVYGDRVRRVQPSVLALLIVAVLIYLGVTAWHIYGLFFQMNGS